MPPGVPIPELGYADVGVAAKWLCEAFGFSERLRIAGHRVRPELDGRLGRRAPHVGLAY